MIICGSVRFTETKIEELDDGQVMISIPKNEISSLQLSYGQTVEKPKTQLLAGSLLIIMGFFIGLWPLLGYLSESHPKGGAFGAIIGSALTLFVFGFYLIKPIFSKGYYILIVTNHGSRKVNIGNCTPTEVVTAGKNLGYQIENVSNP
ncbi:hypothetical protein L4X63_10995 [Geomonas sp. Red32]|uniref:hypothetical protein n=1 Tax=Geomonas sp. Red32 TaxID=2912856 RepID=UPI00202CE3B2|nr:hypothetical protein [Geomonas sp. Red32]MCM0082117.1 hypothetical protein [Geomonas sp. Red32]